MDTTFASVRALRAVSARPNTQMVALNGALAPREIALPKPADGDRANFTKGDVLVQRFPAPQVFSAGPSPFDFDQMNAGDCWIISSMHALAVAEPQLLENAIRDNGDGTYTVRLYKDGNPVDVEVDDRFYKSRVSRRAIYGRPRGESQEIWGAIIEKAYASLQPEGYAGIYGGYPKDALRTLTGRESDETVHATTSDDRLFEQVQSAVANKRAVVTFTEPDTAEGRLKRVQLQGQHAYAVIGTQVEGGNRYILLRNTADRPEMRTDKYDAEVKADVPPGWIDDGLDGAFRIRIDDYRELFWSTTILKASENVRPAVFRTTPSRLSRYSSKSKPV